ncbi:MAG TPA: energy-coupling factor transporter transmembrane protein EcfT [Rectinemataceae bacterium]|nr:energy-coupling factor transporter transmembrane protein EcfT [Rectinemataceae bacterium]
MRSLEFFRNVSIGQYIDSGSRIHRFTPATKYLWLVALGVPAVAASHPSVVLLGFAAALALGAAAGVRPGFLLRGLKPALPLFALIAVFQIVFGWPGDRSAVLFRLGPLDLTQRVLGTVVMAVVRTISLMTLISLFTSVTTEGEIAHGIEDSLSPLARLGFPAHSLALAVATAFRFVPIVAGELESIVKAQAARGADFGSGRGGPFKKTRAYLPLFVPVTIRALERAEALAEAMEARCYSGGNGRTRYLVYETTKADSWARAAALAYCAAALILDIVI